MTTLDDFKTGRPVVLDHRAAVLETRRRHVEQVAATISLVRSGHDLSIEDVGDADLLDVLGVDRWRSLVHRHLSGSQP